MGGRLSVAENLRENESPRQAKAPTRLPAPDNRGPQADEHDAVRHADGRALLR
jgi:hypothetical protein